MATVCIIGPTAPYRGGIAHYTALLARELAEAHRVHVVNFSRMYPGLLFPGKTQFDEGSNLPIGFASERSLDSILPHTWLKSARHIARIAPDRVVFQWWHPFFSPSYRGVSAALRRACPTARQVFLCHNVRPHEASRLDDVLVRIAFGGADAFVVQSESERRELEGIVGPKPTAVHPHPVYDVFASQRVERAQARRELGLEGDVLLFFGYVRAYKGLRVALEALPQILGRRRVTLVVAGEFYEDRSEYDSLIRRLGIGSAVRIHDEYIPNERVAAFFEAADLIVQPYVTATQSGISQVAFAFGKPVLATRVGGLPDAIQDGETGLLVPPEDPNVLARAVLQFFEEGQGPEMAARIALQHGPSWSGLAEAVLTV